MASGIDQKKKSPNDFDLDQRSVEELKVKAIAAKERAYCKCYLFFFFWSTSSAIVLYNFGHWIKTLGLGKASEKL